MKNRITRIEGGGFGSLGLSLALMPNYDEKDYPFVLVKEDNGIYLF
jgi:hypothetical protein